MLFAADMARIELHVDSLRKSLGVESIDNVDLMSVITKMNRNFPSFNYLRGAIEGSDNAHAKFISDGKKDII